MISKLQQQAMLAAECRQATEQKEQLQRELSEHRDGHQQAKLELEGLEVRLGQAETHLQDLDQLVEARRKIKSFEEERLQLQPHQPCPLCGATEHPYVEGQYSAQLDETVSRRNDQAEQVKGLHQLRQDQRLQVQQLGQAIQVKTENQEQLESRLNLLVQGFTQINQELITSNRIEDEQAIRKLIDHKENELEKVSGSLEKIRSFNREIETLQGQESAVKIKIAEARGNRERAQERLKSATAQLEEYSQLIAGREQHLQLKTFEADQLLSKYGFTFNLEAAEKVEANLQEYSLQFQTATATVQQLERQELEELGELSKLGAVFKERTQSNDFLKQEVLQLKERLEGLRSERQVLFEDKDSCSGVGTAPWSLVGSSYSTGTVTNHGSAKERAA